MAEQFTEFSRLEVEAAKYLDVVTIMKKLQEDGRLSLLYQSVNSVFTQESEFTINQFSNQASIQKLDANQFFKFNSEIFKNNLLLIIQIICQDVWANCLNKMINAKRRVFKSIELRRTKFDEELELIRQNMSDFNPNNESPSVTLSNWHNNSNNTNNQQPQNFQPNNNNNNNTNNNMNNQNSQYASINNPLNSMNVNNSSSNNLRENKFNNNCDINPNLNISNSYICNSNNRNPQVQSVNQESITQRGISPSQSIKETSNQYSQMNLENLNRNMAHLSNIMPEIDSLSQNFILKNASPIRDNLQPTDRFNNSLFNSSGPFEIDLHGHQNNLAFKDQQMQPGYMKPQKEQNSSLNSYPRCSSSATIAPKRTKGSQDHLKFQEDLAHELAMNTSLQSGKKPNNDNTDSDIKKFYAASVVSESMDNLKLSKGQANLSVSNLFFGVENQTNHLKTLSNANSNINSNTPSSLSAKLSSSNNLGKKGPQFTVQSVTPFPSSIINSTIYQAVQKSINGISSTPSANYGGSGLINEHFKTQVSSTRNLDIENEIKIHSSYSGSQLKTSQTNRDATQRSSNFVHPLNISQPFQPSGYNLANNISPKYNQ